MVPGGSVLQQTRRLRLAVLVAALWVLTGCGYRGPGQYLELAPDVPPATTVSPQELDQAASAIRLRLRGERGVQLTVQPDRIRVGFPTKANREWFVRMCTRQGVLEFVLMPENLQVLRPESLPLGWEDTRTRKELTTEEALKQGQVLFTGADLAPTAEVVPGAKPGDWEVRFELQEARKPDFAKFTRNNVGRLLAIALDREVLMAPVIRSEIPGKGVISAQMTRGEASDLALILNAPSFPFPLKEVAPSQSP